MAIIYITYGFGSNLAGCFSKVEAESEAACYFEIGQKTKMKYAFSYTEAEFAGQVERHNLREVPLQAQVKDPEEEW